MNKDDVQLISRIMAMDAESYDEWMNQLNEEEIDHVLALFREVRTDLVAQMDALEDEVDESNMAESAEVLARVMAK